MFVNDDIKQGFSEMIGAYQSPSGFPQLESDIVNSEYGHYLQDMHPFFTHENFYNCINGLKESNDVLYSDYFRRRFQFAYVSSVRSVVQRKLSAMAAGHTVINKLMLYDGRGNSETIAKRNRFVGFKIYLTKQNLQFVLNSFAVQLSAAQTLNIYIYQANKEDAVAIIPMVYASPMAMQQQLVADVKLSVGLTNNEYIIGYYESDLTGYAIRRDIDLIKMSPSCCNNNSYSFWQKYNKFVNVRTFYVEEEFLDVDKKFTWNVGKEMITNNTNYGLNLQFSILCNITDLVIQQKSLFVELVKQMLTVQLLKDLVLTQQNNSVANFMRGQVGRETFNEFMKPEETKLKALLEETALDVSSLDSVCLPNSFARRKVKTGSL